MRKKTNSLFECAIDTNSQLPFSLCFSIIGNVYLSFPVEIELILTSVKSIKIINIYESTHTTNLFVLFLILGLFREWNQGALKWLKYCDRVGLANSKFDYDYDYLCENVGFAKKIINK